MPGSSKYLHVDYAINPYPSRARDRRANDPSLLPLERRTYGLMSGLQRAFAICSCQAFALPFRGGENDMPVMPRSLLQTGYAQEDARSDAFCRPQNDVVSSGSRYPAFGSRVFP